MMYFNYNNKSKMSNSKEKQFAFLQKMIDNCDYLYKEQIKSNLVDFLKQHQQFSPNQAVRTNGDNFISFIELIGDILIANNRHQLLIGIPKNFPQHPPNFLIAFNRKLYKCPDEPKLLNKQIYLEKNARGDQYFRINFAPISGQWNNKVKLLQVYLLIKNRLNSPAFFVQINQKKPNINNRSNQNNQNMNYSQNPSSKILQQILDNKSSQLSESNCTYMQLKQKKQNIQYISNRNTYFKTHLTLLQKSLTQKLNQMTIQKQKIQKQLIQSHELENCDKLLSISPKDMIKLERMSQRQALKETERKLKQTIQRQLTNKNKKYLDYKIMIKYLYQQMYQNQTKILSAQQ